LTYNHKKTLNFKLLIGSSSEEYFSDFIQVHINCFQFRNRIKNRKKMVE